MALCKMFSSLIYVCAVMNPFVSNILLSNHTETFSVLLSMKGLLK